MIPAQKIQSSLREGYAFPCACCEHLHWAKDRGLEECRAAVEGKRCGGLLAGMGYPEYKGPLTREAIAKHCFRCGNPADKVLQGNVDPGMVGCCKRHLPLLNRVMEVGADPDDPLKHETVDR